MLSFEKITVQTESIDPKEQSKSGYLFRISRECGPEYDKYDHPDDCNPGCHPDGVCPPDHKLDCSPDGDAADCDPDGFASDCSPYEG